MLSRNHFSPLWVLLVLVVAVPARAANKDNQQPDREMLRMMEFLGQMEMIKQMEIIQDMRDVEGLTERTGKKHQPIESAAGA